MSRFGVTRDGRRSAALIEVLRRRAAAALRPGVGMFSLALAAVVVPMPVLAVEPGQSAAGRQHSSRPPPKFQLERRSRLTFLAQDGDTVSLLNQFGSVDVQPGAGAEASVESQLIAGGDTRACVDSCLKALEVRLEPDGRRLVVRSGVPVAQCGATQYEANLTVRLPAGVLVAVENSYGNVVVTDIAAALRVANRFGGVTVRRCGFAEIANSFGDVTLTGLSQGAVVKNRFGTVEASDLGGSVQLANDNGAIRLTRGSGEIELSCSLGEINALDCSGWVQIRNLQAPVTVRHLLRAPDSIRVRNQGGGIRLVLALDASALVRVWSDSDRISAPAEAQLVSEDPAVGRTYLFGAGRTRVDLSAQGGDITIEVNR